ncbi:putative polyamine transporter [Cryptosporidium felis]|nr:putative polyamine transporter [Cryptosporidium felis]
MKQESGAARNKVMPWASMVFASFFTVSGGSYGSEVVLPVIGVRNFTLIQICICFFYAIPLIIIYELLYKSFPNSSGPKSWCEGLMGSFSTSFIEVLYIFMEVGMLSSYVGVASAYIHSFSRSIKYGAFNQSSQIAISAIIFLLIIGISLLLTYFDDYTMWMFYIVVLPLVIMVVFTFCRIPLSSWKTIPDLPKKDQLDWIIGLQYVMWLNCGYERSFPSNLHSERTHADRKSYKFSLIANAILISIMYILPLWCGCCILNYYNKDNRSFQLGNFFTLSGFLVGGNLLSSLITISACFSSIGCITSDVGVVSQFVLIQWCRINNYQSYNTGFYQETSISLGVIMVCSLLTLIIDQQHFAAGASTLYGFITLITVIVYLKFLWTIDSKDQPSEFSHLVPDSAPSLKPSHSLLLNSMYFRKLPLKLRQVFYSILAIPTIFFTLIIFFTTSSVLYLLIILIALILTPVFIQKKGTNFHTKNSEIEKSNRFIVIFNLT